MSKPKYLAEMLADPADRRHGTVTGYSYGCRCRRCREARAAARRDAWDAEDERYGQPAARKRRTQRWYESMAASGKASVCPICGRYTLRACGMHARCEKEK